MKKINILLGLMILLMASCGGPQNTKEELKEQLVEKKKELSKIQLEIERINKTLDTLGIVIENDSRVLVETKLIEPQKFNHYIEVSGNLESEKDAFISPETNGQIKEIYVKSGDKVTKGQKLVQLNTDVTQKSIQELKTSLELAKTIFKKQKSLWEKGIGSELEYLQSKNNVESLENKIATFNEQLEMSTITAPFSGIVEDVYQKVGEIASPGRQVLMLVNIDDLEVNADVSESYIPFLKIGEKVKLSFPTYPDFLKEVKISNIGKVINPDNRTIKITMNIENSNHKLIPNMMSNVIINDYSKDSALVVPSIILKNDIKGGNFLYVAAQKDSKLISQKRYVTIGKSYKGEVEIIDGLESGDRIIVKGYNVVKNGMEIREKENN